MPTLGVKRWNAICLALMKAALTGLLGAIIGNILGAGLG